MSDLTTVELVWLKKRIENYIRFGKVASNRTIDRSRRVVSFAPGSIFAFVRWTANDFGTVASRIDILRAVSSGKRCSTIAYVRPGADILLTAIGWPNVEKVLQIIDSIEAIGIDPVDVSPDYWRHAHSRLAARETPRPYTRQRHEAWLLRRRIEP
ncbi:DUF2840 domain-containing protein [Mesorhizobium sp. M4B.F.Ca.ET.169.01.1.1]|uniref:DUF2840 domain-containing protein n=1 Tax=unclassified Mesorhizobium TaxID=325217 RepID=UPI000FCA929D|nr:MULTISPECIES: DUF2840 domain-containing protein [unclassified Mesorhizobium]RVD43463.1 DUF2840 domain-containing protein [Mesorhizobium sp. M4B.F.Ca.ET.019.03.1.1]TGT41932.1 DUF2840 domain-containing protein [Mesorhizobium sp. M4B.F.Ca.ET.169.01.1.1]